ncbi:metallophosphoesterase [Cellulosilyticum ruminicola]|uniref:metallophosphoesterase n=1 Tax=Cellulosilyticum ruminicola TaxID=425254 RepID=UPI0006D29E2C|nr:metallophosphoesterase [Cellulosilyticum ruminicola]
MKKINELKPDLLIFTGDLIDDNKKFNEKEDAIRILSEIETKYGKFAVAGNHDYGSNGIRRYKEIMKAANFQLLMNEHKVITLENGKKLNIIGIDDAIFGKVDLEKAMLNSGKADYNIVLCHEPDLADEIQKYPADLQLSGHSHGGQVRIPFKGAILTPPKGKKYVKGLYDLSSRMKLYVNTGVGTSQQRFRLGTIPELTVINLN